MITQEELDALLNEKKEPISKLAVAKSYELDSFSSSIRKMVKQRERLQTFLEDDKLSLDDVNKTIRSMDSINTKIDELFEKIKRLLGSEYQKKEMSEPERTAATFSREGVVSLRRQPIRQYTQPPKLQLKP